LEACAYTVTGDFFILRKTNLFVLHFHVVKILFLRFLQDWRSGGEEIIIKEKRCSEAHGKEQIVKISSILYVSIVHNIVLIFSQPKFPSKQVLLNNVKKNMLLFSEQ
jgi:hypothetical protein